jgi:hypothetical protein
MKSWIDEKRMKENQMHKNLEGEEFSKCLCFLASKILHWIHNSPWLALWNNKFEFLATRMDDVLVGDLL